MRFGDDFTSDVVSYSCFGQRQLLPCFILLIPNAPHWLMVWVVALKLSWDKWHKTSVMPKNHRRIASHVIARSRYSYLPIHWKLNVTDFRRNSLAMLPRNDISAIYIDIYIFDQLLRTLSRKNKMAAHMYPTPSGGKWLQISIIFHCVG